MRNHDPHIESLLEKFMQGETSLEQERELNEYFANSTSIPKEWEVYREMFAYFDAGMPIEVEKRKHHIARPLWALAAAAIATIAIIVAQHLERSNSNDKTNIIKPITAENENANSTLPDTIIIQEQAQPSHIVAIQECKSIKERPHTSSLHATIDSMEIEREQGEVEQAQQELMADKLIIEQERQEALNEQYLTRTQAHQAQLAVQNESPQFTQVVFK